jgi:hypothetical protein
LRTAKQLLGLTSIALLSLTATGNIEGHREQTAGRDKSSTITGRVFRSDTNESIASCLIVLVPEEDSGARAQGFGLRGFPSGERFDLRTDEKGNYLFNNLPAGRYTVSLYAWFGNKVDVPCQDSSDARTADGGSVIIDWDWKSKFREFITIKGFSIRADRELVLHKTQKDFDLLCK